MSFSISFDFLALFQIFWNFDISQPKKIKPIFQNSNVYMDLNLIGFFVPFLGLIPNKFH